MTNLKRCGGSHLEVENSGLQECPVCHTRVIAIRRWGGKKPILNTHTREVLAG